MFVHKIEEERELRLLEMRNADEMYQLIDNSRSHLKAWLPWVDYNTSVKDSEAFIEGTMKQWAANNGFQAGIFYKGELAGVIGLHNVNWTNKSTTIGYWLGEAFTGKGLMSGACQAVVDYCFNELKLNRIEIRVATGNEKSAAIPERLGFQKEGCVRQAEWIYDHFVDHWIFGLLKEDWNKTKLD
jgi:ribosomal-protein-serine acetyltransferase